MQFLLATFLISTGPHPDFYAFTPTLVQSQSVKENVDYYQYKHRHAEQPREKIFTHGVLLTVS
jgi:hypothetical protein